MKTIINYIIFLTISLIMLPSMAAVPVPGMVDYCGQPEISNHDINDRGLFIWQDCDYSELPNRELWYMSVSRGDVSDNIRYKGRIESPHYVIKNLCDSKPDEPGHTLNPNYDKWSYSTPYVTQALCKENTNLAGSKDEEYTKVEFSLGHHTTVSFTTHINSRNNFISVFDLDASSNPSRDAYNSNATYSKLPIYAGKDKIEISSLMDGDFIIGNSGRTERPDSDGVEIALDECLLDEVGGADSSGDLEKWGYYSVVKEGAIPNDDGVDADDTVEIQSAINYAYENGLSVYFPPGEYLVNDTLYAAQKITAHPSGKPRLDRRNATSLIGSVCGKQRPVIKLNVKVGSSFENPPPNSENGDVWVDDGYKPVVWLYAENRDGMASYPPGTEFSALTSFYPEGLPKWDVGGEVGLDSARKGQPDINMNQVVKGIDFDLNGPYTSKAVAIRHAGAQGSSISDVRVDLGSGYNASYAAFDNSPGQGGGVYNVEVIGGEYALTTNRDGRYTVIAGAKFIDQEEAAIRLNGQTSMTMAGFHIKNNNGNAIVIEKGIGGTSANNITLVDGLIEIGINNFVIDNKSKRNVYMDNVYIDGTSNIVSLVNPDEDSQSDITFNTSSTSIKATDFIYDSSGVYTNPENPEYTHSTLVYSNSTTDNFLSAVSTVNESTADELISKHIWSRFPSFEHYGVKNVRDVDYPDNKKLLDGDGNLNPDVTFALQHAINKNPIIFLPPGTYKLSNSLKLNQDTKIIGAGKTNTRIMASATNWETNDPIIRSGLIDGKILRDGHAILAHLLLEAETNKDEDKYVRNNSFIEWRAGKDSIVRDIMIGTKYQGPPSSDDPLSEVPAILITKSGGGRWYGVTGEWDNMKFNTIKPGYRSLKVKDTYQNLALYGLNIERSKTTPQMEIEDSQNVSIYYLKGESRKDNCLRDVLHINGSTRVNVYGSSGNFFKDLKKPNDNPTYITPEEDHICNNNSVVNLNNHNRVLIKYEKESVRDKVKLVNIATQVNSDREFKVIDIDESVLNDPSMYPSRYLINDRRPKTYIWK